MQYVRSYLHKYFFCLEHIYMYDIALFPVLNSKKKMQKTLKISWKRGLQSSPAKRS
jgi:hypothetical protein